MAEFKQKQENERLMKVCSYHFVYSKRITIIYLSILKEKAMLEEQLNESVKHLKNSKTYIDTLQKQTKEEKINRAKYLFSCL